MKGTQYICVMKKKMIYGLLLLFSLGARGQEVLTLQQCRDMALENNKEMSIAAKQIEGAEYLRKSVKGNFFPSLKAYGTDMYASIDGTLNIPGGNLPVFLPSNPTAPSGFAYFPGIDLNMKVKNLLMTGLQLEQPLYMGGKIRSAYQMSKLGTEVARLSHRLTSSEVILQTENAYALLVKANEMKKVATSYHALLEELMKMVESAHKHGLKPKNDVLKVQVKLNESELAIRKAENACRLATMNLCHLIGQPLDADLQIESVYPHVPVAAEIQGNGIADRPEYGLLDRKVALAEEQVKMERSEWLPKVGVRGSFDYTNGLKVNDQKLFDQAGFAVMLNVSVPIYHFGERHNKIRAAKVKLEQARLEQADLTEKMLLELQLVQNDLDEARLEADLADRSLAQAAENEKVSKSEYNAGLETLSDHLEAQALWQQAYATQVDAHFQLYLQYVKYLKATGKLSK